MMNEGTEAAGSYVEEPRPSIFFSKRTEFSPGNPPFSGASDTHFLRLEVRSVLSLDVENSRDMGQRQIVGDAMPDFPTAAEIFFPERRMAAPPLLEIRR